jgi:hypothetical protein
MIGENRLTKAIKKVYFCNGTTVEISVFGRSILAMNFIIVKLPAGLDLISEMYDRASRPNFPVILCECSLIRLRCASWSWIQWVLQYP